MGSLPHKCAARSGGGLGVKTTIQRKNTLRKKQNSIYEGYTKKNALFR
jgi:hypothetical protein